MATLSGQRVKDTYRSVLTLDNGFIGSDGSIWPVQSGDGVDTALSLGTDAVKINGLTYPVADGSANQVIKTDGAGTLSFATVASGSSALDDLTDVVLTAPASSEYLKYNGSNWVNSTLSGNISVFTNDSSYTTLADVAAVGYATATSATAFTNKTGNISQWTNDSGYATATSATAFSNKTGNISQWTNDSGYLTAETQVAFRTIAVSGQSDVVADTTTDTLTLAAGANVTITTDATTDTVTIASSGGGGLSDADYGDVTVSGSGTVMTVDSVTVADAAADATTWPMLSRAVTGANQVVSTDPGLTYDASANSLATTTFVGALTGNASTATALQTARAIGGVNFDGTAAITPANITIANESTDTTCFPLFTTAATGDLPPKSHTSLTFNSNTVNLGCTTFTGALAGNATTATSAATLTTPRAIGGINFDGSAAITPANITIANEATDTTCFPLFTTAATGDLPPKSNANLTFNSNTASLACTTFVGALTGASTSCSGNAATVTVADASNDTTTWPLLGTSATGSLAPATDSSLTYNASTGALSSTTVLEAVSALSDGATPALDASLGSVFTLTASGNRTIAVPTNATSGQKIVIRHTASGADRTLALNSGAGGFRFGTDITALTATTSAKTDYIGCIYNAADSKWDVVAYVKGF